MLKTRFGGTWFSTLFGTPFAVFWKGNGPKWGIWPSTAPFCPIFVAVVFLIELQTVHIKMAQITFLTLHIIYNIYILKVQTEKFDTHRLTSDTHSLKTDTGQWVVKYERIVVENRVHAAGNQTCAPELALFKLRCYQPLGAKLSKCKLRGLYSIHTSKTPPFGASDGHF